MDVSGSAMGTLTSPSATQGRRLLVGPAELDGVRVRDMMELLTSLCGRRSSMIRDSRAVDARHGRRPRVKTIQAYRFALDLTPAQERAVLAHAGAARVAHNWALARVKAVMDQRAAERSYGIADEQLTPACRGRCPRCARRGTRRRPRWRRGGRSVRRRRSTPAWTPWPGR